MHTVVKIVVSGSKNTKIKVTDTSLINFFGCLDMYQEVLCLRVYFQVQPWNLHCSVPPPQAATEPAFTGKTTNGYVPWHGLIWDCFLLVSLSFQALKPCKPWKDGDALQHWFCSRMTYAFMGMRRGETHKTIGKSEWEAFEGNNRPRVTARSVHTVCRKSGANKHLV